MINEILATSCVHFGPYYTSMFKFKVLCKPKISTAKVFAHKHKAQIELVIIVIEAQQPQPFCETLKLLVL